MNKQDGQETNDYLKTLCEERPPRLCYYCKYRQPVERSVHSKCSHPKADELEQTVCEQGKRGGWFNHPNDFDPVWLDACSGHTEETNNFEEMVKDKRMANALDTRKELLEEKGEYDPDEFKND